MRDLRFSGVLPSQQQESTTSAGKEKGEAERSLTSVGEWTGELLDGE